MSPELLPDSLLVTEDQFSDLREGSLLFEAGEDFRKNEFKQLL
jgi:hypothetical protein